MTPKSYEILTRCGTLAGHWGPDRLEIWQWVDGDLWLIQEDPSSEWFVLIPFPGNIRDVQQAPNSISH